MEISLVDRTTEPPEEDILSLQLLTVLEVTFSRMKRGSYCVTLGYKLAFSQLQPEPCRESLKASWTGWWKVEGDQTQQHKTPKARQAAILTKIPKVTMLQAEILLRRTTKERGIQDKNLLPRQNKYTCKIWE